MTLHPYSWLTSLLGIGFQEIDEGDQAILDSFGQGGSRNLADLIMAKLEEHEQQNQPSHKGKGLSRYLIFIIPFTHPIVHCLIHFR